MKTWPKRPDGKSKRVGEMTAEERREIFRGAAARIKAEFADPLVQEKIAAVLRGENVQH